MLNSDKQATSRCNCRASAVYYRVVFKDDSLADISILTGSIRRFMLVSASCSVAREGHSVWLFENLPVECIEEGIAMY